MISIKYGGKNIMIVKSDNFTASAIIAIQYSNRLSDNRYSGVKLHLKGGSILEISSGSEVKGRDAVGKLTDIMLEEKIHHARGEDCFEYIVIIEGAKVVSKQLLTEDKIQKVGLY